MKATTGTTAIDSVTIVIPVRGTFADWAAFDGLAGAKAAPDAAPAGDGITNLIKNVCGLDPMRFSDPQEWNQTGVSDDEGVSMSVRISRTPLDVLTGYEASSDLNGWNGSGLKAVRTSQDSAFEWWRVSIPFDVPSRFLRFTATAAP